MKCLRVENYIGVVKKLAWQNWQRLPKGAKCCIDPEDLFTEGMAFVRYSIMEDFDPNRGNRFMTLLYISLDRFYKTRGIELCRRKRTLPGPIDEEADPPAEDIQLLQSLSGEQGLLRVYSQASPMLRKYLESWFFSSNGPAKVFKYSVPFTKASKEFRRLAMMSSLDINQCRAFLDRRRRDDYRIDVLAD